MIADTASRRRSAVGVVALAIAAGCGGRADAQWPTEALRTVVRRIDDAESQRTVVVAPAVQGAEAELSWGAQQALITAGYVVAADAEADSTAVVSFARPQAAGDGWVIDTSVRRRTGSTTGETHIRWSVRCSGTSCVIGDSVVTGRVR